MNQLGLVAAALVVGSALPATPMPASTQAYPTKPVTLIAPFAPGGGSDAIARIVATRLSERLGSTFVVDNRGGAGTNIGNELAARAKPDGYTLLLGQVTLGINPSLYPKLGYNVRDLTPIGMIATSPTVLVVAPAVPANNVKEPVALAKFKPGALYYGSGGNGTSVHLAGELFKSMAGIDITHVPYKVGDPTYIDTVSVGRAFVQLAPERVIWGTDWPHPSIFFERKPWPDDARMLDQLAEQAPDEAVRRKILVDNPVALFGLNS